MSTNVGYATLDVIPSMKGFQGQLERGTRPGLLSAGRSGGTLFGDTAGRSAGQRFGSVFKSAAKAGILGGLALAAGAIKLGVDALGEAGEAQRVGRQTAAVIKSTGGAAKVSERDVSKLAGRLSYMAGVDDELIQANANVLLTFKGVRNEVGKGNRIFDRATKVALNMSTALGTDLKGASVQVGKALNDPVKGITALARAGVTFTTKQRAQIKALVEGGDANAAMALGLIDSTTTYNNLLKENGGNASKVAQILKSELNPEQKKAFDHYAEGNHLIEAQKRELQELGSEFGGSARSQATAADRLKVAFGNVEEKIGRGLLPVVQDLQRFILRKGIPVIDQYATWFRKDGADAIDGFIDKAKPIVHKWLPKIGDGFKTAGGYAKDAAGFAGDVVSAFDNLPGWVKKVLVGGVAGGLTAKKLGLGKVLGGVTGGIFSKGGNPTNPLFVIDVGKGVGSGGLGAGTKTFSALQKGGLLGAFGITAVIATKIDKKLIEEGVKGALQGGGKGTPFGGAKSDVVTLRPEFGAGIGASEEQKRRIERFNDALRGTNQLFFTNKQSVEEFGGAIRERIPRTIKMTVTGWDVAQQDVRDYISLVLQARGLHVDTRLDRAGVTSPVPGGGINPGGNRGGDKPPSRGPTVIINGDVRPNDSKEFFAEMQRRSRSGAQDGWR